LRHLLPLLLILLAPLARADYEVKITGGIWTTSGSLPTRSDSDDGQNTAYVSKTIASGGSNSTSAPYIIGAGQGSSSCTGAMTAHFHWTGTSPRPDVIVVKQVASASWSGDSGHCSTGLTPETVISTSTYGESVTATKYTVRQFPAADFDVALTPTSDATKGPNLAPPPFPGSPPPPPSYATSTVSYEASYVTPTLTLTGPTPLNQLAIGQKLLATVSPGIPTGTGDTYTWSAPSAGKPFKDYVANATGSVFYPFELPANNSNKMECYFAAGGGPTIACTFHSAALGIDIPLTKTIAVFGPNADVSSSDFGSMQLRRQPAQTDPFAFVLYANTVTITGTTNPQGYGIKLEPTVQDPPFLNPGSGLFGIIQLVDSTLTVNGNGTVQGPFHTTGLDLGPQGMGFPYHRLGKKTTSSTLSEFIEGWMTTGTGPYVFIDAPGILVSNNSMTAPFSGNFTGFYQTYLFYKPVNSLAGPSVFVPIVEIDWTADGHFVGPSSGHFDGFDDGSSLGLPFPYPDFPIWP